MSTSLAGSTPATQESFKIVFDMWKVYDIEEQVFETKEQALSRIREIEPRLKPHSKKNVVENLKKLFGISVPDAKIETLNACLKTLDQDSDAWQMIFGLVEYLRFHYLQKNYISCIIKHGVYSAPGEGSTITLEVSKDNNGIVRMKNGQKLFHVSSLWECVIESELTQDFAIKQHHRGVSNGS